MRLVGAVAQRSPGLVAVDGAVDGFEIGVPRYVAGIAGGRRVFGLCGPSGYWLKHSNDRNLNGQTRMRKKWFAEVDELFLRTSSCGLVLGVDSDAAIDGGPPACKRLQIRVRSILGFDDADAMNVATDPIVLTNRIADQRGHTEISISSPPRTTVDPVRKPIVHLDLIG